MSFVDVATVPYEYTILTGNEAEQLVTERFNLAEQVAIDQIAAAEAYLAALSALFTTAVMPESDISYDFQSIALDSDITGLRPEAPTDSMVPGTINVPQIGELKSISIPTITIPSYSLVEPENTDFTYDEVIYSSALYNVLQPALIAFIIDGGTGLGADVEAALFARARARQDLLNERTYTEAEEFFASRGYTVPPGALSGRLTEALTEQTRADAQLNYEITIEQARLARAQSEYTFNASLQMEGQDKEMFNNVANRAFEAAKAAITIIIDLYNAKVQAFIAQSQGAKLIVEAEKIKVDAAVAANSSVIDAHSVEVEKYKAQVAAELGIVEQIARVYGFQVAGYEADAKVAAVELEAQIKVYQGNIEQANNQTTLTLKEAEMAIQSYLGALQLTADAQKHGGTVSSQIAASALSAVNASATLGSSAAKNRSTSSGYSASLGNSANLGETHLYDETAV